MTMNTIITSKDMTACQEADQSSYSGSQNTTDPLQTARHNTTSTLQRSHGSCQEPLLQLCHDRNSLLQAVDGSPAQTTPQRHD